MSHSLNSLSSSEGDIGTRKGTILGVIKGYTQSEADGSYVDGKVCVPSMYYAVIPTS